VLTCPICTAPLPPKKKAGGSPRKFCSLACKARNAHYKRTGKPRSTEKVCTGCGTEFSVTSQRNSDGKLKRSDTRWCNNCRPTDEDAASSISRRLFYKYRMTLDQYQAVLASGCEICGTTTATRFHIDHDHNCCPGRYTCGKCVRGLLCGQCNQGIGLLNDDPDRMIAAAAYVLKNQNVLGGVPSRS
jgi:hypothetical protein